MKLAKRYTIALLLLLCSGVVYAQGLRPILQEIEQNNKSLQALRSGNEAMRLDNLAGLNLADPDVRFSYMWGINTPNKINVEVMQEFDFPTLSGAKKRLAKSKNDMLALQYRQSALDVQLQAREAIVNLTYYNALIELYNARYQEYQTMYDAASKALEHGEITIMDMNSIKMHRYTIENDLRMARIEQAAVQNELDLLNGGKHIEYNRSKYCPDSVPANFNLWCEQATQNNPVLQAYVAQLRIDTDGISLAKKEGLPTLSAGYVNEILAGESLHGFAVGFSLPLWSNHGKVKAAKAAQTATQAEYDEAAYKFVSQMQAQYDRTASLAQLATQYDEMVKASDNKAYLDKSLQAGKMSMIDYVTETDAFCEMKVKALDAWREYHLSLAKLLLYAE